MGQAILSNLIRKKIFSASDILAADHNPAKRNLLKKKYGVFVTADNRQAAQGQIILLAVKPQQAQEVFQELTGLIKNQTVISIMAGLSLASVRKLLKAKNVVRAMPNTPAQISQGMTVWRKTGQVNLAKVRKIFRSLGEEFEVSSDDLIDKAAAISGSGPAYIYLIMEYLTAIGRRYGFTEKQAEQLVGRGFIGGILLLSQSKKTPRELRQAVTSKKGTTEAALKVFKKRKLGRIFSEALNATLKRAKQLKKIYG
jgi:pyrroline-5-carboxylate reductase